MRDLQIANENRRKIVKPDEEDEQAIENYDAQMRALIATDDDMEAMENEYATLQTEEQQLQPELESLNTRKKNMALINDQVGGWTKRVIAKMQDQLGGMTIQTEDRPIA